MEQLNVEVDVVFNDNEFYPDWNGFDAVLISPGPGLPHESGFLMNWLTNIPKSKPVLGICLGLQAMVVHFGGALRNLESPLHGQSGRLMAISNGNIWSSISVPIKIGHYHSWVADEHSIPRCLDILAVDEEDRIMAVMHKEFPWYALQFHPESILSENGIIWFERWIEHCVRPNSIT